jgi:hypothetical protein
MLENLENILLLLGKSLESTEIKALFAEWNVACPKVITCTANNEMVRTKMEQNGLKLYFGRGGNSRYLKPQPTTRKGSYTGLFTMIEFLPKYTNPMPFGVTMGMSDSELTAILGEPAVVDFMGKTTTWRKPYQEIYELVVSKTVWQDGKEVRAITLGFIYEPDLYTLEDYQKIAL